MNEFSFIEILSQKWRVLFWFTVFTVVLSLVVSLVQIPKYKATVAVLITQKYGYNTDVYAAAKFTEYLSNLLNQVIYSKSFLDQVLVSDFGVKNDFSVIPEKRTRQWKRMVKSRVISNTGIISISIFHRDRVQAEHIADAVSNILVTKSDQYHGAGQQVTVRIIDGPTTRVKPAIPNYPVNLSAGLILGLVLGSMLIYLYPGVHMDRLFGHIGHWLG